MKDTSFSPSWKRSIQPRKQRKYRYNAPLHVRQKFMHVHLSPELRKKYSFRNIQLKTGDKVKILRGKFKKKDGKVEKINLRREQVFITGIERIKKEGTKSLVPFTPSNLMIIELDLTKKRKEKLESKTKGKETKSEKVEKKETKKEPTKTNPQPPTLEKGKVVAEEKTKETKGDLK